jgi:hypothetical protein
MNNGLLDKIEETPADILLKSRLGITGSSRQLGSIKRI